MKKGFIYILISTLTSFNVFSQAHFLKDTVVIDMGEDRSLEVVAQNFHDYPSWKSLDSIYDLFVQDLSKIEAELIGSRNSNNMVYNFRARYRTIQFNTETTVKSEVSVDPEGNIIRFQKVEMNMKNDDRLTFRAASIEDLKSIAELDLDQIMLGADSTISPNGRKTKKHKSAYLIWEENQFSVEKSKIDSDASDMIELGLGFGLGTVRSVITPDVEFSLMVGLSKKGRIRHEFGLSNQWLFSFPNNENGGYDVKTEGFLDAVYSLSLKSESTGKMKRMGIKAGALVTPNSYNFRGQAYRVGLFKSLGHGVSLEGGIFIHDNFGELYPYARLSWTW